MDALKRKMEIAAVVFFCTVTALIAACSCATTAAANLARQTAVEPVTEYEDMKPTIITTNYNADELVRALTPKGGDGTKARAIIPAS